jgi:hypothetical protein
MRMKPKGDSSVGTGQRITQGDTMLEGNEHVRHRPKSRGPKGSLDTIPLLSRVGSGRTKILESSLDQIAAIRYIGLVALVRYTGVSLLSLTYGKN